MIFIDDNTIKVGGIILPGLIKNIEIKTDAKIDEQEVEGSSTKPKQATGYEDGKINVDLIVEDSEKKTKEEKLKTIQSLFRKSGQGNPNVYEIVNQHTAIRGIRKVIFKSLSSKETNKKSELEVSIEFWEYVVSTITVTKKTKKSGSSGNSSSASSNNSSSSSNNSSSASGNSNKLNKDYTNYLKNDRGKAPKLSKKTYSSPARDTANGSVGRGKLIQQPY